MNKLIIFRTEIFWKAALMNALFIVLLIASTSLYLSSIEYPVAKLEKTEFMQLKITNPEELAHYSDEILQTKPVIVQIYIKWILETIAYIFSITLLVIFLQGNVINLFVNKKLLMGKELKNFAKFAVQFTITTFIILITIFLVSKTFIVAHVIFTLIMLFYFIGVLIGSAVIKKQQILKTRFLIKSFITKFLSSTLITLLTAAIIVNVSLKTIPATLYLILPISIIWKTWVENLAVQST